MLIVDNINPADHHLFPVFAITGISTLKHAVFGNAGGLYPKKIG
jgi:hypothetical protein